MLRRTWFGAGSLAWSMLLMLAILPGAVGQVLHLDSSGGDGHPRLTLETRPESMVILESSPDLARWSEWLRGEGGLEGAPDLRTGSSNTAVFYRALIRPKAANDDAKHLVRTTGDSFLSPEPPPWQPESRWIKFAILLDEPERVWFQDSGRYTFHYDFARVRLPGFSGLTRAEFDAVTLRRSGQRAVLGAVVFPPTAAVAEYGIQFVGLEPYPREQVAEWFRTVQAMIHGPPGTTALYLPTFEQAEVARQNRDWFESRGVRVSGSGRWVAGDECYAPGWALGRLVYVPGREIGEAYRDGRLRPDDVLLTDGVPAEVPPLAGIVSLSPATPNSHVALLARSFGIPFVHVAAEAMAREVEGWVGREVMVRAVSQFVGCSVTLAPLVSPLSPTQRSEILALKEAPALDLPAKTVVGQAVLPADGLKPADIGKVGGKAANFGVLRRRLPNQSPSPAVAITFDLWDAYLDQPMAGGTTLRSRIAARLAGFSWPPDMAALETALTEVREWITDEADFTAGQRETISAALVAAGFDTRRNIRFRSSTNVEDTGQFSGAGLYDSYSGCLADDLDDDQAGPSACDATETRERGVFRALRKVYASFYNGNAFLERLRHRVDETRVGMAVLVHPSTPDEFELANGVATFDVYRMDGRSASGQLVTQIGAVSVTNPDSAAVPETVGVRWFSGMVDLSLDRRSSLVPLGDTVLEWESEYRTLVGYLNTASLGYEAEFPGRTEYHLDFEYKKEAPSGRLSVKQVREVPRPPERTYVPWLLGTSNVLEVLQGEHGDIVAMHRLKSRWALGARHVRLEAAGLGTTVVTEMNGEWRDGTNRVVIGGAPSSLPGYRYRLEAERWVDAWSLGEGADRRSYELSVTRIPRTDSREGPLLLLADHAIEWSVDYTTPRPTLGFDPILEGWGSTTTSRESVRLVPKVAPNAESLRQVRDLKVGAATIRTEFWWPAEPKGPTAGYTAPLQAWIETTISGLTSRPLVLRSEWAQTYHPGHHNFWEEFAFEPRLDPDVPTDLLQELEAKNVKAIVVSASRDSFPAPAGFFWGLDDRFRKF